MHNLPGVPISRRDHLLTCAASATALTASPDPLAQPAATSRVSTTETVPTTTVTLLVNGRPHTLGLGLDTPTTLLDALREHLHLTGSEKACDQGQCGVCTVIVDGQRIVSCLKPPA